MIPTPAKLTPEEIQALPAGRELDEAVAIHVDGCVGVRQVGELLRCMCPGYRPHEDKSDDPGLTGELFHYSTEPRHCSIVKARVAETHHWTIRSPFDPSSEWGSKWWAGVTPHGTTGWNGRSDIQAHGATEEEAVCRCALLLVHLGDEALHYAEDGDRCHVMETDGSGSPKGLSLDALIEFLQRARTLPPLVKGRKKAYVRGVRWKAPHHFQITIEEPK